MTAKAQTRDKFVLAKMGRQFYPGDFSLDKLNGSYTFSGYSVVPSY